MQTIDSQKPHTGIDSPILLSQQAVQELQICIDFVHQFLRDINLLGGEEEGTLAPQLEGTCINGQTLGIRGIVDPLSHIQMFQKPPFSRWPLKDVPNMYLAAILLKISTSLSQSTLTLRRSDLQLVFLKM